MRKTKGRGDNKVKYGTISLPLPLINIIKERIEGTGMSSVSSYVAFVLRQILSSGEESQELLNKGDEKEVKRKLKSLGYA